MTDLKNNILELKSQGLSYRQIQEKLGCSKGTIAYHLGTGQKDKTLKRNRDRRNHISKWLHEYKSGKCCADCGENYPYWMLDFDHLPEKGSKSFNIALFRTTTMSLEKVKEEVEKCEVVCANCHRNRTFYRILKDGSDTGIKECDYPE